MCRAVAEVHRRYTRMINFREGWRGCLWQGRFASFVMSEKHLMGAVRYVERNPVKADLVERAEDWRWSSAAAHCAACDGGEVGDMTQMRSGAKHLGSCTQTGPTYGESGPFCSRPWARHAPRESPDPS